MIFGPVSQSPFRSQWTLTINEALTRENICSVILWLLSDELVPEETFLHRMNIFPTKKDELRKICTVVCCVSILKRNCPSLEGWSAGGHSFMNFQCEWEIRTLNRVVLMLTRPMRTSSQIGVMAKHLIHNVWSLIQVSVKGAGIGTKEDFDLKRNSCAALSWILSGDLGINSALLGKIKAFKNTQIEHE